VPNSERECERIADDVRTRHGLSKLPICPRAIARNQGIEVHTGLSREQGVTGVLMRVGEQFGIYHASHIQNEGFIRFTIAHELGHYFLPGHPDALFPKGDGVHCSQSGFQSQNQHEREADQFACGLLMPRDMFLAAVSGLSPGFSAIESLKDTCQTSILATAIRYAKLVDVPVAVIVSSADTIEYAFLSSALRAVPGVSYISRGTSVPARCQTRSFNRLPSNISCARTEAGWTSLDDWIAGAPQVEMKEDVVGLGGFGRTLTVLFSSG
jgi:hypothetical protein